MSFVTRKDILDTFEGLIKYLFKEVKGVDLGELPHISYADAMTKYGSDKPDLRFGMEFRELNDLTQGKGFVVFDSAELVVGINATGCGEYTRKELDGLTDFVEETTDWGKGPGVCVNATRMAPLRVL